ncbi:MAG: hypothetical protein KBG20_03520 [Caldilineaceae bacterium]|nr:hypothetical protein [Caldilineaceae bacterium]MBP8110100.1 hypothetical protein [Caldilineaceae bacterium]MBP8124189.1 hypothetical protein [Caldilineaceae bacterium]MBP9071337.1 hypothetical protein [Caldilineaceae bacterium]
MNSAQMMVPKRFGMLRVIGILLKVLAWLSLVMGVVGAVTGLLAGGAVTDLLSTNGIASPLGGGEAIILALGGLLTGLISFLALYAAGEGLFLQLAVEENTRITAALLMKMDQEAGAEAGYAVVN